MSNKKLEEIAKNVRRSILEMSYRAQSAHTGGALSAVEILVSLYFKVMKVFPNDPWNDNRDRLIFSKAHDAKVLYATLAERGYFDKKILEGYELNNGKLAGHSTRRSVPGVEASAGSLGHGLPIGVGVALAGKLAKKKFKTYVVMSDGECNEGTTWEAALFAGHHSLDNLIVAIDYNKLQGFGFTSEVLELEPFSQKWVAFGWGVVEVDGHSFDELIPTFSNVPYIKGKPTVVVCNTIKGLGGVKKHVNQVSSQYKPPTKEELDEALKGL